MEKESLCIFKLDTQGGKEKFPNADMPAKLGEYTYTAQRMAGTPTLTATLNYPSCLDEQWTGEEFVEFRGEKYYIDQVPTSSKDNKSIMYKHELQFVSERIVLENVYFMDVVTAGADTYHSNSTSVKFMGDINEFVGRLNASMEKSGIGYSVVIDEDITSDSKLVSLDNVYLAEAFQSIYTVYELPYYFVGKVCHIGYTENVISTPFEYRKGFISIKKTNANYKIVNRVTGVGSSDNIPFYYPNDDENGKIERCQNLMPSVYRESSGAERFYNALDDTYKIPGKDDYYSFKNQYSPHKVKEFKVDFSDIKPTIEGVTNASGQLFGEIADIAFDENDSDELGTGEGNNVFNGTDEYVHSYFYIKLHIYNGDYGFNLFEQGLEGGTAVINMTTGNCAACAFEIGVTYKDSEPQRAFNPVLVDSSGNLPAGNFEQKVTSQTSQYVERQQNTSTNSVWIAVKKDNTTFGVVMPNATNNYKPSIGDKFVITGIKMPKSLVLAAEKRLDEALIKYMSENNDEKFTFSVNFSRVFLADNIYLWDMLNENARIYIKYNNREYLMYVNSFTCKADKNCLYDISVELTDKLSANVSALRSTITEIAGDIIGNIQGGGYGGDILAKTSKHYIRKDQPDSAKYLVKFLKGIHTGLYTPEESGGMIDEEGNAELKKMSLRSGLDSNGPVTTDEVVSKNFTSGLLGVGHRLWNGVLEVSELIVRKTMHVFEIIVQKVSSVNGSMLTTPGGGVRISEVEELEDGYKCLFNNDDGTIPNPFVVGDQALHQVFTGKNIGRYWRLVTEVGDNYFVLSKTDCEAGSGIPQVEDEIIQFGNRTDKNRQNAVLTTSYGSDAPYTAYYSNVNSYSLEGKEDVREGNLRGINDPDFGQLQGSGFYGKNVYLKGIFRLLSGKTVEESIGDVQSNLDNLQVGETNLLDNSNKGWKNSDYLTATIYLGDYKPKAGEQCTIVLKGVLGTGKERFEVYNSGGSGTMCWIRRIDFNEDNIASVTFNWNIANTINEYIRLYAYPSSIYVESEIEWVKLVLGNKTSLLWTPSINDQKQHAIDVAATEAALAETRANAYADGIVTEAEQNAINEAQARLDALQIGSVNLISKKMMLKWNEKNKDIAVWGQDADGIYLDVTPKLLFDNFSVSNDILNPIFDLNFKVNTQYVLAIEWKSKTTEVTLKEGLIILIKYTDGGKSDRLILTNHTTSKTTVYIVTQPGRTIQKISSSYGYNVNALIYNISLIEGNKPLQGFPVAEEDQTGANNVNLADGTKEFTLVASTNYTYKELYVSKIKPNTVYYVNAGNIQNLAGNPDRYSFVLYNKDISTMLGRALNADKNGGFLITYNNFTEQEGYLLCYAGIAGSTLGNSVKFTEVMLVEGFLPAPVWTPSHGDVEQSIQDAIAKTVDITAPSQVFKYGAGYTGTPSPASIVLTALPRNFTPTSYQWQYLNGSTWTNISGATSSTYSVIPGNTTLFPSGTNVRTFRVVCDGDEKLSDSFTLAKLADGAQGAKGDKGDTGAQGAKGDKGDTGAMGTSGADAYTVLLTNESHAFAGSVSAALAGSTSCAVVAYKGATQVAATIGSISGLPAGMTASITNNGTTKATITFTVTTSMTTASGTVNIPVTVDGKSFTRVFSYSIAFKGATGAQGAKGDKGDTGAQGIPGESINGKMLCKDPEFKLGLNGTKTYHAQNDGGSLTVSRIQKSSNANAAGSPYNDSDYCLYIKAYGGTWTNHLGGFYFANQSRANAVFIVKVSAKIPVGYTLKNIHNRYGTDGKQEQLTSMAGTGKYETYIFKVTCGSTGTFSTINHLMLSGPVKPSTAPLEWFVDYATVFDQTADGYSDIEITTKDSFAAQLGFTNFEELKLNAVNSSKGTLIQGGYINTNLIKADALIAIDGFIDKLKTNILAADSIKANMLSVAGFNFADYKIYGGAAYGSGSGIQITSKTAERSFKAYKDTDNYIGMYYNSATDWGIKGVVGGATYLQLGDTNKIAGLELSDNGLRSSDFNPKLMTGSCYAKDGFSVYASGSGVLTPSTGGMQAGIITAVGDFISHITGLEIIAKETSYDYGSSSKVTALRIQAENRYYGTPFDPPLAIEVVSGDVLFGGKMTVNNTSIFRGQIYLNLNNIPNISGASNYYLCINRSTGQLSYR